VLEQSLEFAARNSLTVFTEYLGYTNASFHDEWYSFLQNNFCPFNGKICPRATKERHDCVKRYVLLWPRGHAKTECTTVNYVSWLVGNHPNIHVNIVTKTASLAEEILTAIMTRIETDRKYIEVFGDLKPLVPRRWTSHEIIVNRKEISKNATIKASGLLGPITGGRSDLIVCDDVIDEENVRTRLQIEKVHLWFNKVLYPTLYPWGAIIVIGTRWSYADLYDDLLRTWPHDIKQAWKPDGTPLWSGYWTPEKLHDREEQVGSIIFRCQYMNDPTGMEGDLLKSEWLHPWETEPLSENLRYAGVDPALGEGDYQGIATISIDKATGKAFLEDVWAKQAPFPVFLQKLRDLYEKYHYAKIFIESNAFQKILTFLPELQGLPIVASHTGKDKESRFIPMSSHFESQRILLNPTLNLKTEFWMEWVQFPRGQHDDGLDAVEIVTREVVGRHSQGFVFTGR